MRKKVFILMYARLNLGDDLFLDMILRRYKNVDFYININGKYYLESLKKYDNINIIHKQNETFDDIEINLYDGYIYIGGSIFMEEGKVYNLDNGCKTFMRECKKRNIPFYYVSSNFGPYISEEYFDLAVDVLGNCTQICFRDRYSYDLFKHIPTVRYAPDIVFLYDFSNKVIKERNSVGITVIDLSIRNNLADKENIYYKLLSKEIIKYIDSGNKVSLFSFCKFEGDEEAIDRLLNYLPKGYKDKISCIYYNGNINEFIGEYQKMEFILCSKFHGMILSIIFNQKFYMLSYSKKINRVMNDLQIINYNNLNMITENTKIDLNEFKSIDLKKVNDIKIMAKEQFEKINEWLC